MSLDATFYGFATLADAKAAWHQQLARILSSMLDRGVIIDALVSPSPSTQQIVATDGAAPAILWALWRALEGGSIATSYWQTTTGESYLLEPAATDDFCQQLTLGITKYIGLCKANARTIGDAIDAAGTIDAVLVIDMGAGWPSNALAAGISWDEFHTFLSLTDTPNSYSGQGSKIVRVNAGATALEFVDPTFLALTDTPSAYTSSGLKLVRVNSGATALEFSSPTFLSLDDTPASFSGAGSKLVMVNSGASALEFVAVPALPYLLAFDAPGAPTASMIVFHHVFTQAVTFVASLTGSYVKAGTAATAQTDFDLKKNGSSIGTVRFAASGTTASYVSISSSSWAAGDILTLVAPATPDTTIADIWGTLVGVR